MNKLINIIVFYCLNCCFLYGQYSYQAPDGMVMPPPPPVDTTPVLSTFCGDGSFDTFNFANNGWKLKGYTIITNNPSASGLNFVGNANNFNSTNTKAGITGKSHNWEYVNGGPDNLVPILGMTKFGNRAMKIGETPRTPKSTAESIMKRVKITSGNSFLSFFFAQVCEKNFSGWSDSYFAVMINGVYAPIFYNNTQSTSVYSDSFYGNTYMYRKWTCANVDLTAYIGDTIDLEFVNSDCAWNHHSGYTYIDGICFTCPDSGDVKIDSVVNCNIFGSYKLPSSVGPFATLNSLTVNAFKNGSPVIGMPTYIVPTANINTTTKKYQVSLATLKSLYAGLNDYDIVVTALFSFGGPVAIPMITRLTSNQGFYAAFNNDVTSFTYIKDSQLFFKEDCLLKVEYLYPKSYQSSNPVCEIKKCNFKPIVDSFNFDRGFYNFPNVINGYYFNKLDSGYDCLKDIKWYEIKYRCISACDTVFFSIRITSDCNIVLCDRLVCGSDAGTILNPFLSNLKGALRPDKTYTYNTKRTSLSTNNTRLGEHFTSFSPLFSYSNWSLSTDVNWINSKQVTLYNHKGNEVESKNPLNIFSATRFGFNHSLPIAVASNSKYRNFISWGFDDEEYYQYSCSNSTNLDIEKYNLPIITSNGVSGRNIMDQSFNIKTATPDYAQSHTGNYSYKIIPTCNTASAVSSYDNCDKFFLSKVIPLCGPSDPNYADATYNINSGINAQSVANSYNAKFNLEKGKKYILSYWVRNVLNPTELNSEGLGYMKIYKNCDTNYLRVSIPKTNLIEGWKQMTEEFEVETTTNMVKLVFFPAKNGTYYDDIRIFPFDANMKSFVYHPRSLKLSAELDENNYATFYDYDEEGNLVRIRKETERGIMTIKEQRNVLKTQ